MSEMPGITDLALHPRVKRRATARVMLLVAFALLTVAAAATATIALTRETQATRPYACESPSECLNASYVCDTVHQSSGYIKLRTKRSGAYFYWYFESRANPATDPLVVWISGGPGCSGLSDMLALNGPCRVNTNLTTSTNENSWNTRANVVWLDQPLGAGFSWTDDQEDLDSTSRDVAENLFYFLEGFYDRYPALRGRSLYLTGQGYAGHFIPVAARYIAQRNRDLEEPIVLDGIAIGNGLTAPRIQFEHYVDMANNSYGVNLVANATALEQARRDVALCLERVDACQQNTTACADAWAFCAASMRKAFKLNGRDPLDIRKRCQGAKCRDTPYIRHYLHSPRIMQYLGVPHTKNRLWKQCNESIAEQFISSGDALTDHHTALAKLLNETSVRVVIYAGDADTVSNWWGTFAWVSQLQWRHQNELGSEYAFFLPDGTHAGTYIQPLNRQLTAFRLFKAGQLVPRDQPQVALRLLDRLLDGY